MYLPAEHDEITGLVNYLDEQLTAIRASVYGLTEEQARSTPCRSALSIGGLIKHATYGMEGWLDGKWDSDQAPTQQDMVNHQASSQVQADESVEQLVAEFDAARPQFLASVAGQDPGALIKIPPAPWFGVFQAQPAKARFPLVHLIEEFARHAGHADIIREQIDGATVPQLTLSMAGVAANSFFQPFEPQPGTLR